MAVTAAMLRRFSFLSPLGPAELRDLAPQLQERHYPADTLLFPDGEIGNTLFFLLGGQVRIIKQTSDGEIQLNRLAAGDSFGEMSLLDGAPRSGGARAEGDITVLEMPRAVFQSLIERFPILLYHIAQESAQRQRRTDLELIGELQRRNRELRDLYDTSLDISRHLDLESALAAIVERAAQLLSASGGALHLYDPVKRMLIARGSKVAVKPGQGAGSEAFASSAPVIRNGKMDVGRSTRGRTAARHELAAPIKLDRQALGAITLHRPTAAPPFVPEDAQLLLLLANQAAIAIENARLFGLATEKGRLDGELHAAREVQRRLIPKRAPRVPGFQLAALWRPAHEVAGDFYDFIPLPRGRWGIVIADVSDKGAPAALFMAEARSILRASATTAPTAAAASEHANTVLAADAPNGMFVTVFWGILEPRTCTFEYVNAGHNPPLLRRAGGRIERLRGHSLALGVDPEVRFPSRELRLAEGDLLVLYTDGVTEALNGRDELFGDARLARTVKSVGNLAAPAAVRAIDTVIRAFVGARTLADDVTCVVLSARRNS